MTENPKVRRICIDRVVPASYNPARAMAHQSAVSHYIASVQAKAGAAAKEAATRASFGKHIATIGKLGELSANDPVAVARMAVINQKKWPNGSTLSCKFLDGDDQQQEKVVEKAKIWEQYANVQLDFGDDPDAQIRISFQADPGSWSAIGTDCLVADYFPKYQPTMNYGWLTDDTDDQEYERVVVHEFGHALGCIHEHQSPTEHLNWNKEAVYATFSGPPNFWSKEDIDHNILEKYSPDGISATVFDIQSIMLYQFDASLFTDNKGTPTNTRLSQMDEQMIGQMYPQAGHATGIARIA
jgi:hypothetical protein